MYSASDAPLRQISEGVRDGANVQISFKSGFARELSTIRHKIARGPLREAAVSNTKNARTNPCRKTYA